MSVNHLIIGLGGTGGKIIRDLRKIIAADSTPSHSVNFEYLYMDTNDGLLKNAATWRVLGTSVELDQGQTMISTATDFGRILDDVDAYTGIKPWIEPISIFKIIDAGVEAAGQRRKLGRLLFARNAKAFVEKLKDRVNKLEEKERKSGATFHVLCGLAGGTGSGCVVDVVAQIRKEYPDYRKNRIVVYAFIPEKNPPFNDGDGRYYANGYAALAELNAMATGAYRPFDVISGARHAVRDAIWFNGCYLVNNENESGVKVNVQDELPKVVAEFIYQKTLGTNWEGLISAENSENGTNDDEKSVDGSNERQRALRFLTFGIKRVVVPEEEIKEYLTYSFAQQATRQLMFNNWQDGVGFAEEVRPQDFHSVVRQPDFLNRWLISDDHLTLSIRILPDDDAQSRWKKIPDFWLGLVHAQKQRITGEVGEKQKWMTELTIACEKVFDEGYRALGGVKKFYETKVKARAEMAKYIRRTVEKELFADWENGVRSLAEIRKLLDVLMSSLEERLGGIDERSGKLRQQEEEARLKISEIIKESSQTWTLTDLFMKKGEKLFNQATEYLQQLYICRTTAEGWAFGKKLLESTMAELTDLRNEVSSMSEKLAKATSEFQKSIDTRLKNEESSIQDKLFNKDAIESVKKAMLLDEQSQKARVKEVRSAIIRKAGVDSESFTKVNEKLGVDTLISVLEDQSQKIVVAAHNEVAQSQKRVLDVNIVERLYEDYGGDDDRLRKYVLDVIADANSFLTFDGNEESRKGAGTTEYEKHLKTSGLFLPECKEKDEFSKKLSALFEANKTSNQFKVIREGARTNELVMMRIDNLFPLRFAQPLAFLKTHYDRLCKDNLEKYFLHGEGDGSHLPPLYIPSKDTFMANKRHFLVLGRVLGLIIDRKNVGTGLMETVISYEDANGLPDEKVLGRSFATIFDKLGFDELGLVEKEVIRKLAGWNIDTLIKPMKCSLHSSS